MKRGKSGYKYKAIELAKRIVRKRVGRCEWCGKADGVLHGAHIMSVRYAATAADPDNILCLCYRCHFYRWHSDPMETSAWFEERWPGRYDQLRQKAQQVTKYTEEQWQEIYKKLKEEYARNRLG